MFQSAKGGTPNIKAILSQNLVFLPFACTLKGVHRAFDQSHRTFKELSTKVSAFVELSTKTSCFQRAFIKSHPSHGSKFNIETQKLYESSTKALRDYSAVAESDNQPLPGCV